MNQDEPLRYTLTDKGIKALNDHDAALVRECPMCDAVPGQPCRTKAAERRATMHAARYVK